MEKNLHYKIMKINLRDLLRLNKKSPTQQTLKKLELWTFKLKVFAKDYKNGHKIGKNAMLKIFGREPKRDQMN